MPTKCQLNRWEAFFRWAESERDEAERNAFLTLDRAQWVETLDSDGLGLVFPQAAEALRRQATMWAARAEAFGIVAPKRKE